MEENEEKGGKSERKGVLVSLADALFPLLEGCAGRRQGPLPLIAQLPLAY